MQKFVFLQKNGNTIITLYAKDKTEAEIALEDIVKNPSDFEWDRESVVGASDDEDDLILDDEDDVWERELDEDGEDYNENDRYEI